jgi:hypothetical protein
MRSGVPLSLIGGILWFDYLTLLVNKHHAVSSVGCAEIQCTCISRNLNQHQWSWMLKMLNVWHPVHTAPSTALLWLGCYGPIGIILIPSRPTRLNKVANQITRSACDRACKLQQDSNRTVNHQLTWYSRLILNKPRPPNSKQATPTALWSMLTCRCPNNGLSWYTWSMVPRPWPLYWWTHSLKIKYLLVIFSGRQRIAR